jgi:CRP-like cAMP-binding protein
MNITYKKPTLRDIPAMQQLVAPEIESGVILARSNDEIASTDTEVYVLTRVTFYKLSEEHKKLAFNLIAAIARTLAIRLRHADTEMTMLREY